MDAVRVAIYRFFDADDELLYVGISSDPALRWMQHRATKPWASEVAMRVIEWLPSRLDALLAEVQAIRTEQPRYNGTHTPYRRSGRPRPSMKNLSVDDLDKAVGYVAIQDIAELLGTKATNISGYRSQSRPGHIYANDPFPAHDTRIVWHPAWRIERLPEIFEWYARHAGRRRSGQGRGGGQPSHRANTNELTKENDQ